MANTGNKQASIAFKVSEGKGDPLDVNGTPVSVSGKRQAIFLLEGFTNPDPGKYEVEGYFKPGEPLDGVPTMIYSPSECLPGGENDWILRTGAWDMAGHWYDDETWKY